MQLSSSAGQDLGQLTALAEGALLGENVESAISGFEIHVMQRGEVLYHQAFGNWSMNQLASTDSSTKTLSGALMMSIVDSGESDFSLDSPLSEFLNEYDQPDYRDITVRQAFSHTSGIEGQELSLILAAPNITLRRAAELIQLKPLVSSPPGSAFDYGGLSMQAAGAAAEVATDTQFVDLFANRITAPLEMTNTQFVIASDTNPRVAGGVQSTATDYARFMDMLLNKGVDRVSGTRVLSSTAVQEMLTRQTTDSQPIVDSPTDNHRYGIGVWLDQFSQFDPDGPTVDALAGGARGFHSWIDESHELVFTFSTDLTRFGNVEFLSSLMHRAVLEAVSDPGDFNFDGQVDGADFLLWQRGGLSGELNADDLAQWRASYVGASTATPASTIVAEPSTALIALGVMTLLALTRRGALACVPRRLRQR